ncbi:MAG: lactate permease [Candidatus Coatesbacteria bacterium 4484_99]|uniref:L-lactate permease n=1 Tax=Candidatus Coatesbacteria bacterium 4484_99 TaxID=1970774 RepID=A0A1W9S239_9BACT|nr:MAG: lactate permease [Candidatus Coatesbacteria bacterium 4484_99]
MSVFLALLPVVIIFIMLAFFKKPADTSGFVGWVLILLIAILYFKTSASVAITASLAGVVASFPISLMVATSLFQITYMEKVGAIRRLVVFLKSVSPQDKVVQILIINVGFGTLITALGATPVSILPPIMIALGYTSFVSIALPAIGYDALCTYALLGIPIVIFTQFTGITIDEAGAIFSRYMPVISTLIAFGMLYIVGRWRLMWRGAIPTIITGLTAGFVAIFMNKIHLTLLTGVGAGIAVMLIMMLYLLVRGKKVYDPSELTDEDIKVRETMPLWKAVLPWIFLVIFATIVNVPGPIFDTLFKDIPLAVSIIPIGKPIPIRLFWQAYWWVLISTLVASPFYKGGMRKLFGSTPRWIRRAPRPVFSACIFFAIAYVMNWSGYNSNWHFLGQEHNIVSVLAVNSARLFGEMYGLIAPYLGLLGGFISGSETSSIAMLTRFHLQTSQELWGAGAIVAGLLIAAASGIGGGLASVISPAKLQNAAAAIDRIGEESRVIRTTLWISLVITLACAILTVIWLM